MTPTVRAFQFVQHRTAVLMLDRSLEPQLAFTNSQGRVQVALQMQQALDFALHLCDLALKHGVHLGANMVPSAQRQKLLDLAQSKPKLLRMTNELEFVNVLII